MLLTVLQSQNSNNGSSDVIEAIRTQNQHTLQALHDTQLQHANEKVQEWQQAAMQDPLAQFVIKKAQMQELGMIPTNDGREAGVEEKTIDEVSKVVKEGMDKFDSSLNTFAGMVTPLIQTWADNLKRPEDSSGPPQLDSVERLDIYEQLLENTDAAIEQTSPATVTPAQPQLPPTQG